MRRNVTFDAKRRPRACATPMLSLLLAAPSATPYVTLNNGVQMPAVAAGTWQYTTSGAQESVTNAIKAGFTHIDTAHDYCADGTTGDCTNSGSSNQVGIGRALADVERSKFFLTTKVPGCGLQGISRDKCGADSVKAALKNLDELGLDYVDLLLVHFPPGKALPDPGGCSADNCGVMQEQWHALSSLVAQATPCPTQPDTTHSSAAAFASRTIQYIHYSLLSARRGALATAQPPHSPSSLVRFLSASPRTLPRLQNKTRALGVSNFC